MRCRISLEAYGECMYLFGHGRFAPNLLPTRPQGGALTEMVLRASTPKNEKFGVARC